MSDPGPLVLAVNCGSATLKAAVVDARTGERRWTAHRDVTDGDHAAALEGLVGELDQTVRSGLAAVAHRLVHGGARVRDHAVVDDAVRRELEGAAALAPLHVPSALAALDAARRALPGLPHVATLDTAFHRHLPEVAFRYAVPRSWFEMGVRRYGFHGLSHESVSTQAAALLGRPLDDLRLVTLHLGNGCSGCAVLGGRSVDTTMGFTPLEGLVMGTRSGDLDPGILGYVSARTGRDLPGLLEDLNHRAGLLGLSELSHDVRDLERAEQEGSTAAALALEVYCSRAAKTVAGLTVPLGGMDALVFTGGVGEHSARVRQGIVERLAHLGLVVDHALNAAHGQGSGGRVRVEGRPEVLVVTTDEELVMARAAARLLAS